MGATSIQWCDHSINPIKFKLNRLPLQQAAEPGLVNMCTKISPGCKRCYAESMTRRWWPKGCGDFPGYTAQALKLGEFVIDESKLREVLRRRKPTAYFWCDMTDMFHEKVRPELVDRCFAVMAMTPKHRHLVLTKRTEGMAKCMSDFYGEGGRLEYWLEEMGTSGYSPLDEATDDDERRLSEIDVLPNVWLGTSIEDREQLTKRAPALARCPAAIRYWSAEPLLQDLGDIGEYLKGVQWVIVGGESGAGARPCRVEWIGSILEQCRAAGVACFIKQLGSNPIRPGYKALQMTLNDAKGGEMSEWPEELRVREMPAPAAEAREVLR